MSTPVRASDRDLRALAAIVGQDRPDLPDGKGLLPPSWSWRVWNRLGNGYQNG